MTNLNEFREAPWGGRSRTPAGRYRHAFGRVIQGRQMRSLAIIGLAFMLLSLVDAAVTAASAGEELVMPYTCRVVDGVPVLTPSEDRSYAILGEREERDFNLCGSSDPDMCKSVLLYRFDIDCGGHRVPWGALATAANAESGKRSWSEDERLHLVMPWTWSIWPSEPCASLRRYGWSHDLLNWYCATASTPAPDEVAMPPGFAPMFYRGVFVTEMAPQGATTDATGLSLIIPPEPKPARRINRDVGPRPEAVVSVSAFEPAPAPDTNSAPLPSPSTPSALEGALLEPTPIGALASLDPAPLSGQDSDEQEQETTFLSARAKGIAPSVGQAAADEKLRGTTERDADHADVLSILSERLPILPIVAFCSAVGILVFAMLRAAFDSKRLPTHEPRGADPAFDRSQASHELPSKGHWLVPMPVKPILAEPRIELPPPFADVIPASRPEALRVLRMGVAQEINIVAAKKIIDGLRLSWHPDHARNPEDLRLRQMRMRQINVAWDWIAGRRAE